MTTDQLIDQLVADLKPVDRRCVTRALCGALALGAAAAFGAMLLTIGPNSQLFRGADLSLLSIRLLFGLGVVATGMVSLSRFARPAAEQGESLILASVPFIAIVAAALVALATSQWSTWNEAIVGRDWLTCLVAIPLFAIVPFSALVLAIRTGAPTAQESAGAVAGLVAGGLSAAACACACSDESIPSIAVWYGLPIVICAAFGARLGPRLLRW